MSWILVIADDLTGALEVGAKFAGCGLASRVTTDLVLGATPDVPVWVIDTETRHLPAEEAMNVIRKAASAARNFGTRLIYKKTDSTLRGNIAAEFRALLEIFPERPLFYVPAYPEMGRTVKDKHLFVWGTPVHQTAFAHDPLNPIRESNISVLLEEIPAIVLDGESNADIRDAALRIAAMDTPLLAAGPAALAGALAECYPLPPGSVRAWPRVTSCLVVNGSLHPTSLAQIAFAQTQGCFDKQWRHFDFAVEGAGLDRALNTGEFVRRFMQSSPVEAMIVFGGDTAFGIHRALGAPVFEPYGEIMPGVPLSRCGDLFWITKAGGFGAPDILCDIRRRLT